MKKILSTLTKQRKTTFTFDSVTLALSAVLGFGFLFLTVYLEHQGVFSDDYGILPHMVPVTCYGAVVGIFGLLNVWYKTIQLVTTSEKTEISLSIVHILGFCLFVSGIVCLFLYLRAFASWMVQEYPWMLVGSIAGLLAIIFIVSRYWRSLIVNSTVDELRLLCLAKDKRYQPFIYEIYCKICKKYEGRTVLLNTAFSFWLLAEGERKDFPEKIRAFNHSEVNLSIPNTDTPHQRNALIQVMKVMGLSIQSDRAPVGFVDLCERFFRNVIRSFPSLKDEIMHAILKEDGCGGISVLFTFLHVVYEDGYKDYYAYASECQRRVWLYGRRINQWIVDGDVIAFSDFCRAALNLPIDSALINQLLENHALRTEPASVVDAEITKELEALLYLLSREELQVKGYNSMSNLRIYFDYCVYDADEALRTEMLRIVRNHDFATKYLAKYIEREKGAKNYDILHEISEMYTKKTKTA